MTKMPTFDSLLNPLLEALRQLGGSGSIDEILEKVTEIESIPEDVSTQLHDPERSNQTEVAYRLAWARTYLRKYGLLENSDRGVWSLTARAKEFKEVVPSDVIRTVRAMDKERSAISVDVKKEQTKYSEEVQSDESLSDWKAKLHHLLTKEMSADAFERLAQRMLRESGFVSVEVTGRTGDGGIDGKGIARIHGLMSFHVIFQCKKYQGSISASAIRDFRGAMVGRADKGLFITTGTFTPAAVKEATRDGAPPIDLIDGEEFYDKLRELRLGVKSEMIETIRIDEDWFRTL